MAEVRPCANMAAAVASCAELIGASLLHALQHRGGRISLLLSGGRTPALVLPLLLARDDIDWSRIDLAAADERLVAREDPASTEGMIRGLFAAAGRPCAYHGFGADRDPPTALAAWRNALSQMAWPPTVAFLGLGDDGHTMSLFPGRAEAAEAGLFAAAVPETPPHPAPRLTLGPAALQGVERVVLIANGAAKQARIAQASAPGVDPRTLPVAWLCQLNQTIILSPAE